MRTTPVGRLPLSGLGPARRPVTAHAWAVSWTTVWDVQTARLSHHVIERIRCACATPQLLAEYVAKNTVNRLGRVNAPSQADP